MSRASTMASMNVAERMTADEYLAIDEERRNEQLIAGEVVVTEAAWDHQRLVGLLHVRLFNWIGAGEGRGTVALPLDVKLDAENVYAPDVLWYATGRGPATDRPRPHPVPDIAVEVRSPSTWRYDLGTKKSTYEAHGLPELWLVDTDGACVLVYRRSRQDAPAFDVELELDRDDSLASPQLPGFALALEEAFGAAPDAAV